jgi:EAL domain-containing protein (putative c-di-GMP-specific phosphodiesterase class I)
VLAPDAFLDVAEETGLIVPIGAQVLAQACRHASTWPSSLAVAVNLAPREYRGASVVAQVARALNDAGLPAGRLQIEVNEAALTSPDESAALDVLTRLAEGGVRLVIDNFGAGVASLGALRRVTIDAVKLDGQFVRNAVLDARDGAIVGALAGLGRKLGLRVVAAGVESEDQFIFVRKAGVNEAQGYLLGRPVLPEDFARSLTTVRRGAKVR